MEATAGGKAVKKRENKKERERNKAKERKEGKRKSEYEDAVPT